MNTKSTSVQARLLGWLSAPLIVAFVVTLIVALGTIPVLAAPAIHDQGSLATRQNSAIGVAAGCETPHALGVEGGLLSLRYDPGDSNPVAEIINSRLYALRMVRTGGGAYLAYVPTAYLANLPTACM